MLKSFSKILIVLSILIMPIFLGASYANAATYTCKTSEGNCYGSYTSTTACQNTCNSTYYGTSLTVSCTEYIAGTTACTNSTAATSATSETTTKGSASFKPQVDIGTDFKVGTTYTPDGSTAMIAKYIRAIYKYAIGIVGILAAVVLMIGGVLWIVAGGNATAIGEAKSWIGASLTGLVIALCSYLILATVNPALVDLKTTTIKTVEKSTTESGTGTGCCLGGDNTVTYYFSCKNDIKNCYVGLFPTSDGVTKVLFAEGKKCKDGTGTAKLCE